MGGDKHIVSGCEKWNNICYDVPVHILIVLIFLGGALQRRNVKTLFLVTDFGRIQVSAVQVRQGENPIFVLPLPLGGAAEHLFQLCLPPSHPPSTRPPSPVSITHSDIYLIWGILIFNNCFIIIYLLGGDI